MGCRRALSQRLGRGQVHTPLGERPGWHSPRDARSSPALAQTVGVTAIAAGSAFSLALKSDGTVVAWGDNSSGQTSVPAGLTGVTAISAGEDHSLALKSDGTVVAWGYNAMGQTSVPAGLTGVTAIAAGGTHSLALKSDGTVTAWGDNSYGETSVPPGLTGVIAIAAGAFHSLVIQRVQFDFSAFLPPAAGGAITAHAGAIVPVNFSLHGYQGLAVITTATYTPAGGTPVPAVSPGGGLTYNPTTDTYTYPWKTQRSWARTTGTFTLNLSDGTTHTLGVTFR